MLRVESWLGVLQPSLALSEGAASLRTPTERTTRDRVDSRASGRAKGLRPKVMALGHGLAVTQKAANACVGLWAWDLHVDFKIALYGSRRLGSDRVRSRPVRSGLWSWWRMFELRLNGPTFSFVTQTWVLVRVHAAMSEFASERASARCSHFANLAVPPPDGFMLAEDRKVVAILWGTTVSMSSDACIRRRNFIAPRWKFPVRRRSDRKFETSCPVGACKIESFEPAVRPTWMRPAGPSDSGLASFILELACMHASDIYDSVRHWDWGFSARCASRPRSGSLGKVWKLWLCLGSELGSGWNVDLSRPFWSFVVATREAGISHATFDRLTDI